MITVEYKDFAEMRAVAREILGLDGGSANVKTIPAAPAPTTAAPVRPAAPAPAVAASVRPAAPAPAMAAPVRPAAPAPAMAAPVRPAAPAPATAASVPPAAPTPATAVPTTELSYTLDDLARAGMTLVDTGRQGEVVQQLARFGVSTLAELPKSQYGAFATVLREMGAQI